jgi:hypothetical protein
MGSRIVVCSDLKISSVQRKTFDVNSDLSVSLSAHLSIALTSVAVRKAGMVASVCSSRPSMPLRWTRLYRFILRAVREAVCRFELTYKDQVVPTYFAMQSTFGTGLNPDLGKDKNMHVLSNPYAVSLAPNRHFVPHLSASRHQSPLPADEQPEDQKAPREYPVMLRDG